MSHIFTSLAEHKFFEGRGSMSALSCVFTGLINVLNDGLSWCIAIWKNDLGILHSIPNLSSILFTLLAHAVTL